MNPAPARKSLDRKLARIVADPGCRDFIIADAKDADMAFGLAAPGPRPGADPATGPLRSIHEYRDDIRAIVAQGLVDIMLMSASTSELLAIDEGLFVESAVTPAVRMNDTTDIWLAAGTGGYPREPALPFSTATIAHAQRGHLDGVPAPAGRGADLGLFSLTLNDDAALDRAMLAAYDRSLVVGILGGGAGTTHDAFGLVADAKAHGARVALFGRKINAAENQPAFVRILRAVADGDLDAAQGVRAYHAELARLGIRPHRSLEADLARAPTATAYGG